MTATGEFDGGGRGPAPAASGGLVLERAPLLLQQLAELTSEALLTVRGGRILWANGAAARLVGAAAGTELMGRTPADLVAPDGASAMAALLDRPSLDASDAVRELAFLRADGRRVEVEASARASPDGTVLLAARDVSAQQRYRELFHQVPVGVWEEDFSGAKRIVDDLRTAGVTDLARHFQDHPESLQACVRSLKVLDVNETACRMLGARDKVELLSNLDKVFPPEALDGFTSELIQLASGRSETVSEGWNGRLDGGRCWVAIRGVIQPGHEHDWSRLLVTTGDLTERWLAAEEKRVLQVRLHHAERLEAVGRLAGGVAHDFNNILAAILSFAEVSMEEATPGSELHQSQVHIREAALRARDLVRQILTFSQRDRPTTQPLDVPSVVAEALALARAAIPATVAVEARIDPAAGSALLDPTQLHQIVLNLCSNARDAVRDRGRIEVEVAAVTPGAEPAELPPGRYLRLRVRDDGVGMDGATRQRLFEPYHTTKGGGHGLGLAVVHGIVSGAAGLVRVESAPERGSTFDVYLPRLAVSTAARSQPEVAPRGGGHVLLVDDEPLVRRAVARMLASLGYQSTEAADAEEALRAFRAHPDRFDLVLTDQTMPGVTGAELARILIAERPGTPVILCSGYTEVLDEARARAIGIRAFLAKPVEKRVLAISIHQALLRDAPAS